MLEPIAAAAPRHVVVVGGAGRALARLIAVERWGDHPPCLNQMRLRTVELRDWEERLVGLAHHDRLGLPGMRSRRADLIPISATILGTIADRLEVGGLVVSDWGLREGVILETVGARTPRPAVGLRDRPIECRRGPRIRTLAAVDGKFSPAWLGRNRPSTSRVYGRTRCGIPCSRSVTRAST